jgi:hypothetical protein
MFFYYLDYRACARTKKRMFDFHALRLLSIEKAARCLCIGRFYALFLKMVGRL